MYVSASIRSMRINSVVSFQKLSSREPGGRSTREPEEMDSDSIAAACGDAARLRSHEVEYQLDLWLGKWMQDARDVLAKRGHLEHIRELLPFYFDPSSSSFRVRRFGPRWSTCWGWICGTGRHLG